MATTVRRAGAILACTLAGLIAPRAADATPPAVLSILPAPQKVNVLASAVVQVNFDTPIDPATVNAITFRVFGRWSGPASGSYVVNSSSVTFTPDQPFFAGEWVTVSVSKGIENLAGEGLVKGYAWNFWIKTVGTLLDLEYIGRTTTRQGGETWIASYGAYAGDLDNDGWSDLTVINEQTDDVRVFMNGSGSFSAFTVEGLTTSDVPSPNEMGDFDNDGEIDLVVGNLSESSISLLFGDGTGDFPDGRKIAYTTAGGSSSHARGVGVVDLNGDGWDDIVTASRNTSNMSILINNGDGTFAAAVAKESGGNGETSIAIADANNDGRLDVFCGTFNSPHSIVVLLSDGNGGLTAQPPVGIGGRPWQIVAGDFNGDNNVDVAANNTYEGRMAVLYGNGLGGLASLGTYVTGTYPLAIDAGDIDGDGDLELVSSNYDSGTWTLYENRDGVFMNPRTLNSSSSGSCATLHDRDNDGDLDMTGIDEIDDWLYFFQNEPPVTAVKPAPVSVTLLQNHPNPFNPTTTIRFELTRPARVELSVFDARGALVTTLASGAYPAGATDIRWNGTDARGRRVGSGVYFYRLVSGSEVLTRKMVLLK
jgi:hypothetical protein